MSIADLYHVPEDLMDSGDEGDEGDEGGRVSPLGGDEGGGLSRWELQGESQGEPQGEPQGGSQGMSQGSQSLAAAPDTMAIMQRCMAIVGTRGLRPEELDDTETYLRSTLAHVAGYWGYGSPRPARQEEWLVACRVLGIASPEGGDDGSVDQGERGAQAALMLLHHLCAACNHIGMLCASSDPTMATAQQAEDAELLSWMENRIRSHVLLCNVLMHCRCAYGDGFASVNMYTTGPQGALTCHDPGKMKEAKLVRMYLLRTAGMGGLRIRGDRLFRMVTDINGHATRFYEPYMHVSEWVRQAMAWAPEGVRDAMCSSMGQLKLASSMLVQSRHPEIPEHVFDRYLFSFLNGDYDILRDAFYDKKTHRRVVAGTVEQERADVLAQLEGLANTPYAITAADLAYLDEDPNNTLAWWLPRRRGVDRRVPPILQAGRVAANHFDIDFDVSLVLAPSLGLRDIMQIPTPLLDKIFLEQNIPRLAMTEFLGLMVRGIFPAKLLDNMQVHPHTPTHTHTHPHTPTHTHTHTSTHPHTPTHTHTYTHPHTPTPTHTHTHTYMLLQCLHRLWPASSGRRAPARP